MEGQNSAAYRAAHERFNAGDLEGYLAFYADDGLVFGGITPEPMDKDATRGFHQYFLSAFPGAQVECVDLVASGDRLAARLVLHLEHDGEFMDVEPTGAQIDFWITTLLTMRDGRCVERWSTADFYGLMLQLGAIPAPARA